MKRREISILCAALCVCTAIAAADMIQEKQTEKKPEVKTGSMAASITEIVKEETSAKAQVIAHDAYTVGSAMLEEQISKELADEIETEAKTLTEESNLVIADVTNYVHIRSMPSEEGEILGKLYRNSVGRRLDEENGWYRIESGKVKGYVKAEFVQTGDEAKRRALEVGERLAKVTTTTLKVRKEPSTEATVLGLVPIEDVLHVLEEVEGWVKVDFEEGSGYVSTDYVEVYTKNVEAESKEEEAARLKKEEEERKKAEEAAKKALAAQQAAQQATQQTGNKKPASKPATGTNTGSAGSSSSAKPADSNTDSDSLGQKIANYALKFVGNPYVYGGTSLTNGADCSGFVQSVYKHFGISLPRTSGEQGKSGRAVDGVSSAKPGDLVWYSGHIGIYIGNNQIVHASNPKNGIMISEVTYRKILGIRRII